MKNIYLKRQKIARVIIALIIIFTIPLPVFSDPSPKNFDEAKAAKTIPNQRFAERLVDKAGVFSHEESAELLARLNAISKANDVDIVIATVKNTGSQDIVAFTDDYFDYNGFGMGESKEDGIILLLSMDDRKWAVSTAGFCIDAFSDYGQSYIMDANVLPEFKQDLYSSGFNKFIDLAEQFIVEAKTDKPYTKKEIKNFSRTAASPLWYAIPLGSIICAGGILHFFYNLSFDEDDNANNYLVPGSAVISFQKDIFINCEKKSYLKTSSSNSGSSTHTSSSGREHGGSSGSF